MELEDWKIEVHGEAVRIERALTPQDLESGSAQRVVVVVVELPLERWILEAGRGLTPGGEEGSDTSFDTSFKSVIES